MYGKEHGAAEQIVSGMTVREGHETAHHTEADPEHPEHISAQELIDAVHSKDPHAVRQAMRAHYELMRGDG